MLPFGLAALDVSLHLTYDRVEPQRSAQEGPQDRQQRADAEPTVGLPSQIKEQQNGTDELEPHAHVEVPTTITPCWSVTVFRLHAAGNLPLVEKFARKKVAEIGVGR